jgi:hypothetical protein
VYVIDNRIYWERREPWKFMGGFGTWLENEGEIVKEYCRGGGREILSKSANIMGVF